MESYYCLPLIFGVKVRMTATVHMHASQLGLVYLQKILQNVNSSTFVCI